MNVASHASLRHGLPKTVLSPLLFHPSQSDIIYVRVPSRQLHRHHHPHRHNQASPQNLEWPSHPNPTPYEILRVTPGAPYTKANFYRLAKLYHPDRHHCLETTHSHLSPSVCVERYRLVVLANDILSDPSKRHAYDVCGLGWHQAKPVTRATYSEWRRGEHSPARNATWEDWERWYDARNGKKQEPVYMSHGSFAALLGLVISIAVIGQANRAEKIAQNYTQLMQEKHGKIVGDMQKRAEHTAPMGREERVASFIKDRENALWGYNPEKWDADRPQSK
jgi:hypothetical protein